MKHTEFQALIGAGILGTLTATAAVAQNDVTALRLNVGLPPTHTWVKAYEYLSDGLTETGMFEVEEYYGTLLNLRETVPGLRDGVVDIGQAVIAYFPAEFRESNLVGEMGMLGDDGITMAGATSEYLFNCEPCLAEFERFNQVYLGTAALPVYNMFTTEPITTVEQMKGLSIRSGAGVYSRWAEHFEASPASLTATEVYEGMSQGVISANLHPVTELINLSLYEVADYVTEIPLGTFNAVSVYSMNRDVWQGLTDEQRAVILDLTAGGNAHVTVEYELANREAKEKARELGVEFLEPEAAFLEAQKEFARSDADSVAGTMEANYGIENAEEKVETFKSLVTKWSDLTAGKKTDEAAIAQLFRDEIWDDLDPTNYAMD